jgi:hypothetical protein
VTEDYSDFIGNIERLKAQNASKIAAGGAEAPLIVSTPNQPASTGNGDDRRGYALAALRSEANLVARCGPGARNDTLNRAAFSLASLVAAGYLGEHEVRDTLTQAALGAGLTPTEVHATLASGERGSAAKVGARVLPDRPVGNASAREIAGPEGEAAAEAVDLFKIAVDRRAYDLRVNEAARRVHAREQAAVLGQTAPNPVRLTEFLAVPDEDAVYRITDLLPTGGRVLLAAQYKAGKTTLVANLLRSLVDGTAFLGKYPTVAVGRIALLDTELDERMLRRWLRTQNIRNTDAIDVISLRGRLSTFDITDDETRADWAARVAGADVVVLDCLRPCLDALGLSEDKDAGRFLVAYDALIAEAGAGEAAVVHHMGHTMERSRGDSRLLDWPDVLWKIVRDTREDSDEIDDTGDRYFSAMGRDVMVAECLLDYTAATGELMAVDGGRAEKRARNALDDIVEIVADPANRDGLSQNQLVRKLKGLGHSRDGSRRAVLMAIQDRILLIAEGPNKTRVHTLNPSRSQ